MSEGDFYSILVSKGSSEGEPNSAKSHWTLLLNEDCTQEKLFSIKRHKISQFREQCISDADNTGLETYNVTLQKYGY